MTEPFNVDEDQDRASTQREDLSIRPAPRRVSGLRRRTIRLAFALLAAVVAVALIFGLGIGRRGQQPNELRRIEPPPENLQPLLIADLPSSYADVPRRPTAPASPPPGPAAMSEMHHTDAAASLAATAQTQKRELAELLASIQGVLRKNQELPQQNAAYQLESTKAQDKAWASALLFKIEDHPQDQHAGPQTGADSVPAGNDNAATPQRPVTPAVADTSSSTPPRQGQQAATSQQRKLAFLNDSPGPLMEADRTSRSPAPGEVDRNGYLLQAGTVVPAALLTGINTDLPGDVTASVTQNVYDSPTGTHLLIPQGARLYGTYDSQVTASQNRALLVWNRLLLPDGHSVNLGRMRGTDAAGYAGLSDRVDYHLDKLATASLLSGVIAYAGNLAGGRQGVNLTAGNVIGNAIAQQASSVGSNLVQRQLDVQPTITIRPGWPVRVMVNHEFLLTVYADR